jgi:hypothetical protein
MLKSGKTVSMRINTGKKPVDKAVAKSKTNRGRHVHKTGGKSYQPESYPQSS